MGVEMTQMHRMGFVTIFTGVLIGVLDLGGVPWSMGLITAIVFIWAGGIFASTRPGRRDPVDMNRLQWTEDQIEEAKKRLSALIKAVDGEPPGEDEPLEDHVDCIEEIILELLDPPKVA
jgi:hypothetical protein